MRKKNHSHKCLIKGMVPGSKARGAERHGAMSAEKKAVKELYNRYYKNQVAALYRAIKP